MEIRSATISFSKSKAKCISTRERELRRRLEQLDVIICNNFSSPIIDGVLRTKLGAQINLRRERKKGNAQSKIPLDRKW